MKIMSLFNKLRQGMKKDDQKRKEEIQARIVAILNEVTDLLEKRSVTYFELMDILSSLQQDCNMKIAAIMRGNAKRIEELQSEVKKYADVKPEEDRPKEDQEQIGG